MSTSTSVNIDPVKRQPTAGIESISRRQQAAGQKQSAPSGQDAVMDNITRQNLLDQIRDIPDVRSDVTEIGRRLADDPDYPPAELVDKLANALADLEPGWLDSLGDVEEGEDEVAPE